MRKFFVLVALCASLAMLTPPNVSVRAMSERPLASIIRVTPPPPVFDDKDRVAELQQRRERVAQRVGPQSWMILLSTQTRV